MRRSPRVAPLALLGIPSAALRSKSHDRTLFGFGSDGSAIGSTLADVAKVW